MPHDLLIGGRKLPAWAGVLYGTVWGLLYYCLVGVVIWVVARPLMGPFGGALSFYVVGWPVVLMMWLFAK